MNTRTLLRAAVVLSALCCAVSGAEPAPTMVSAESLPPPTPKCEASRRPCGFPRVVVGIEGGGALWNEDGPFSTSTGLGASTQAGGSWGFRVGGEFTRWLAVEVHYLGVANQAQRPFASSGSVHLFTHAALAELRLTLPLPFVQPYLVTGGGIYSTSITGTEQARAGSPFRNSSEFGIPIGLGVNVPVTNRISLGAELTYHRLFGESLAADDEIGAGDLTTFNGVLRFRI